MAETLEPLFVPPLLADAALEGPEPRSPVDESADV